MRTYMNFKQTLFDLETLKQDLISLKSNGNGYFSFNIEPFLKIIDQIKKDLLQGERDQTLLMNEVTRLRGVVSDLKKEKESS